jgi:hypothetical protein
MSSSRRRNRVRCVDMLSAYRANPRSFSSLAVTPALLAPNSLLRAGGSAPMSRPIGALPMGLLNWRCAEEIVDDD